MPTKAQPLARLSRLQALGGAPAEQAAYALELVRSERNAQVVQAALEVLIDFPDRAARPLLLDRYAFYDADGVVRDPGGYLRAAILRVLRHIVRPDDIVLLERAAATYEFLPPTRSEETWLLRSAALVALNEVDAALASFHAVRLLSDVYTSRMSGEPAVTAAGVLASQGHFLPLYDYAIRYLRLPAEERRPDTLAACLKHLIHVPRSVFLALVEAYQEAEDEIALIGLFDLIIGHRDQAACGDFLRTFLQTTRHYHAYHYLVTLIAANRKSDLLVILLSTAGDEPDPRKLRLLAEALVLVRGDPAVDAILRKLERVNK